LRYSPLLARLGELIYFIFFYLLHCVERRPLDEYRKYIEKGRGARAPLPKCWWRAFGRGGRSPILRGLQEKYEVTTASTSPTRRSSPAAELSHRYITTLPSRQGDRPDRRAAARIKMEIDSKPEAMTARPAHHPAQDEREAIRRRRRRLRNASR